MNLKAGEWDPEEGREGEGGRLEAGVGRAGGGEEEGDDPKPWASGSHGRVLFSFELLVLLQMSLPTPPSTSSGMGGGSWPNESPMEGPLEWGLKARRPVRVLGQEHSGENTGLVSGRCGNAPRFVCVCVF